MYIFTTGIQGMVRVSRSTSVTDLVVTGAVSAIAELSWERIMPNEKQGQIPVWVSSSIFLN